MGKLFKVKWLISATAVLALIAGALFHAPLVGPVWYKVRLFARFAGVALCAVGGLDMAGTLAVRGFRALRQRVPRLWMIVGSAAMLVALAGGLRLCYASLIAVKVASVMAGLWFAIGGCWEAGGILRAAWHLHGRAPRTPRDTAHRSFRRTALSGRRHAIR